MNDPANNGPSEEHRPAIRLMLFVAGHERNSQMARDNLARICDSEPGIDYKLEIIDVLQDYRTALKHKILVTPALLIVEPPPGALILGNLNDTEKVRSVLLRGVSAG